MAFSGEVVESPIGVEGFCLVKPVVVVLMFKPCRFLMAEKRVSIVLTLLFFLRAISPTLTWW